MKRILVINPNTTQSVTDRVLAVCRAAQPHLQWEGVTARFGSPYIASEVSYAVAAHAVLDAFEANNQGHDAVLGLAQASFEAAQQRGPFAVVTGGRAWEPMLQRFSRMHQLDAQLCGIFTVELIGAQIAAAPDAALDGLCAACLQGVQAGAQCIVLGGAALTGLASQLQPRLPVLDNVLLGAHAVALVCGKA